jgi:hypothetical protein
LEVDLVRLIIIYLHIHTYIHTYIHFDIYIYIYIYMHIYHTLRQSHIIQKRIIHVSEKTEGEAVKRSEEKVQRT